MQIRELRTKDTFALARILRKLDLKQLMGMFTRKDGDAEQVGLELVGLLVEKLDVLEADLCAFLGDLCGVTADEFANLPIGDLKDVLLQLAKSPEVVSFFGSLRAGKNSPS